MLSNKNIHTALPGHPSILIVSKSSNSITVRIQLSDIGTAPTLTVELNVTLGSQLQLIDAVKWTGNFIQGKLLDPILVSSLQPSTNYTFKAVAVNQLGPGPSSMEFIFTEGIQFTL